MHFEIFSKNLEKSVDKRYLIWYSIKAPRERAATEKKDFEKNRKKWLTTRVCCDIINTRSQLERVSGDAIKIALVPCKLNNITDNNAGA